MKKKNKNKLWSKSRLWSIDLYVPNRICWLYKKITFRNRNADEIRISKKALSQLKDKQVCNCLVNMHITMVKYKLVKTVKEAHIICDDIKFVCVKNPKNRWPNDVRLCEKQMRIGRCPYKIARILYPDKYKAK